MCSQTQRESICSDTSENQKTQFWEKAIVKQHFSQVQWDVRIEKKEPEIEGVGVRTGLTRQKELQWKQIEYVQGIK